ncbi:hypothetical protein KR032_007038 [Drosophila birchii]|nr:hypothetical protein KR032_007038 [Drosophila birchii]
MDNMEESIMGQSPNADADDLLEMKMEKLNNTGSSNDETEEEPEDGQQDREEVEALTVDMEVKEMKEGAGSGREKYTKEDLRIMNGLKHLPPAVVIAEIEHLEKQMYELSQREAREITRSKQLDIFGKNKRRSGK